MSVSEIEGLSQTRRKRAIDEVDGESIPFNTPSSFSIEGLSQTRRKRAIEEVYGESIPFNAPSSFSMAVSEQKHTPVFTTPKLDSPQRVSASLYRLIDFVDEVETLKKDFQTDNEQTIQDLTIRIRENKQDLREEERKLRKLTERQKYLDLLSDIALAGGAAATIVYGKPWSEMDLKERISRLTTIGITTSTVGADILEQVGLIENRYQNLLSALSLLAFGSYFLHGFPAQCTDPKGKIFELIPKIVSSCTAVETGISNYQSNKIQKANKETEIENKKTERLIQQRFDDALLLEKRLQIEAVVARLIQEYQEALQQITQPHRG